MTVLDPRLGSLHIKRPYDIHTQCSKATRGPAIACLVQDTIVGPKMACDVLVTSVARGSHHYVMEPDNDFLSKKGVSAVSCLVLGAQNVLVPFFNDSLRSVRLLKGESVGSITSCVSLGDWGSDELLSSMEGSDDEALGCASLETEMEASAVSESNDLPAHLVQLFVETTCGPGTEICFSRHIVQVFKSICDS